MVREVLVKTRKVIFPKKNIFLPRKKILGNFIFEVVLTRIRGRDGKIELKFRKFRKLFLGQILSILLTPSATFSDNCSNPNGLDWSLVAHIPDKEKSTTKPIFEGCPDTYRFPDSKLPPMLPVCCLIPHSQV